MRKREFVRRSFSSIARSYDLLNTLLSFCLDKWWRKRAVNAFGPAPQGIVLDACAGTMQLDKAFLNRWGQTTVIALDFSLEMLEKGMERLNEFSITPVCGDAEILPFRDETFDRAMVGFGIRNLEYPKRGIGELFRVLKLGGRVMILEFGRPTLPIFRNLYRWYLAWFVPWFGGLLSHQKETYRYLHDSIMTFYKREDLVAAMKGVGFSHISTRELTWGIANLYLGEKGPTRKRSGREGNNRVR